MSERENNVGVYSLWAILDIYTESNKVARGSFLSFFVDMYRGEFNFLFGDNALDFLFVCVE